ncbi:PKD domain-containing protein [Paenibacillus silvisoli]|uniref:PKD domain-containing protein n=1 Tax=Paenibacillus silvisoli TaxID=3110539 RepID=UPI0028042FD0|nr:PKD domain-containing protein [Paenibacillus silvisoli]
MVIIRKLVAMLLTCLLLIGGIQPAAKANSGLGQWIWWTDEGEAYKIFGGNASITINTGKMQIIPQCGEGSPDGLTSWTDLYIVESGSLNALSHGEELEDVGGEGPNAVMSLSSGIFISETIGYTGPDGKIPPGEYAVVFDECQDGKFDYLVDGVIDPAFKVDYTAGIVPPLDLTQLKEDAGKLAERWEKYREYADKLFKLQKAADAGRNPNEKFVDLLMRSGLQDPRTAALLQLANQAKHYQGIKDDPPDPDYKHLTPLGERPLADLQGLGFVEAAMEDLVNDISNEQAITRQMWTLLERYQGAQAAGDVNWALIHGKALSDNINLLLYQLQFTSGSISWFNQALTQDSGALDQKAAELSQLQARVAASGFTDEEMQYFGSLGFTESDINQFKLDLEAMDFEFTKQAMLAEGAAIMNDNNQFGTNLLAFGSHVVGNINQLLQDPTVIDDAPVADAGGPYSGKEGEPITFKGTWSESAAGIAAYDWDLDSDGFFDDAQGVQVTQSYSKPFNGLIGLRVTDNNGKQAIHYAQTVISDVNRSPLLVSKSPAVNQVEQHAGEAASFELTAMDPDNDPIAVEWFVDGATTGNTIGNAFTYVPDSVGLHAVEAVVTDTHPLGGAFRVRWVVKVVQQQPPAVIELTPESASLTLGAKHTLHATVLDEQGQPVAGTPVSFVVTGANPGTHNASTDHAGVAAIQYTGTQTGEDRIVAKDGSITSNPAIAVWSTEDLTAPTTSAALSPAVPDGSGGSYLNPVTVTLTVEDDSSGAAKTEYRVNEGEWETYSAPFTINEDGTYTIAYRSTDHAGNVEAVKQVSFVIGASEIPHAFFNPVTAGKNVALLEERAKIEDVSGNYDSGHSAENMLRFGSTSGNPWATKSKVDQWVKISLADGGTYLIDRIQIRPRPGFVDQRVKDFEVEISEDSLTSFSPVLKGTLENNGELQEFMLPKPMKAKYILYRPLSSQSNGSIISTQQFKVKTGQIGGETVTFQNLSTDKNNDIVSYEWDFGDNTPKSTVKEPTHTFPGPGTYPVTLTVTDSQGQSGSVTLEQTVEPADFEVLQQDPKEGYPVTLVNTTAGGDLGLISTSTWNFGDNTFTDSGMTVNHTYWDNNTYLTSLEIVMKDGKKYTVKKPVTPANIAPTIDVGRDVTVLGGQTFLGTTRINDPSREDRHTCVWDFGDGTTSTKCHFDHAYPAMPLDSPDRTYTATVTVTDDDGGVGADSFKVTARAEQTPRQIAYYTFDGNFQDSSGNGNHGTSKIGNPTFVEGIVGQAAKFDGKSGVLVEDSDSLDLATSFSFSMWVYKETAGTGGYAPILTKGHTENYGPYSFLHDGRGESPGMRLVSGDRDGYTHLFPTTPMPNKVWYMTTVTWDGSVAKYYINGEYKASLPFKGIFANTTEKLTIGFDPPGATEYFNGMMDDFRMYNYPLSEAEIEQLYEMKDPAPAEVTVTSNPAVLSAGQSSTITSIVKDSKGQFMPGIEVTFTTTLGTITQTAVTDANGAATAVLTSPIVGRATVKAQAAGGAFGETIVQFANSPPVAEEATVHGLEDQPLTGQLQASDADGDQVTFSLVNQPLKGTLSVSPSGQFTYVPGADWNGTDSFSFKANDGVADSAAAVVSVTIDPVNDAPSFSKGEDRKANKADAVQGVSVPGWAADISAGPADESGQTLAFSVTNDRNDLFAVQPLIASDGTLSFTPADNVSGKATVSVTLTDDGGAANTGDNESAAQTFTIMVDSINPEISADFPADWTNADLDVPVEADGTGSAITALKWAAGERTTAFFAAEGDNIAGNRFTATLNGDYTLYAEDEAGNQAIKVIRIANIDRVAPVTTAAVNPAGPTGWHNADAVLTLDASDELSGVAMTEYRINQGDWMAYTGSIPAFKDGEYLVEYRSVDNAGNAETEQAITIRVDTTAPTLTVNLNQSAMWPPNHKMVDIKVTLEFDDRTSGIESVVLTSITSSEPDDGLGDGDTPNDIQGADYGTPDTAFSLRAERSGNGTGRIYTITYTIIDTAGNQSVQTATVTVQHDISVTVKSNGK